MKTTALTGLILLAVTLGALALRLPDLADRPMHADEAVHALKFERTRTGDYAYDPRDFHGPTLYYFTLPSLWLGPARTGLEATEFTYRVVPAIFGAMLVLLLWGLASGLGRAAVVCAGVATALSPALVFYSRFYIQEMLLVFFTLGLMVTGWRYARTPHLGWAVACGIFAGLMHATKETAALSLAAMVAALVGACIWCRTFQRPKASHLAAGLVSAAGTALVFLSGFGTHLAGPLDSLRAFGDLLHRGLGAEGLHLHPWHHHLGMLLYSRIQDGPAWSEAAILALAAAGFLTAVRGADRTTRGLLRFTALYTVLLTAVYSVLPYKTPWCVLPFLHGMILLAGAGAVTLVRLVPGRMGKGMTCAVLIAAFAHLGIQAHRSAFLYAIDPRNPYVHSPSVPDTVRLGRRVEALARLHPDGTDMRVHVVSEGNYWPLPWNLRRLNPDCIGYWSQVPADPDAPVVIASATLESAIDKALRKKYHKSIFGLRPAELLVVYVQKDLWDAFLRGRDKSAGKIHTSTHRAMATTFQIRIAGGEARYARQATQEAFDLLDRLETQLSRFRPDSDVAQLNRLEPGGTLRVAPAVFDCLREAARYYSLTNGAFDVTFGQINPLLRPDLLRPDTLPEAKRAAVKKRTGMDRLELDEKNLTVRQLVRVLLVDLGGIGKGYALDRMAALLKDWSVKAALLHGGHSSVLALGSAPGKAGWTVTLPDPENPGRTLLTLELRDRALGASGLKRGAFILDPRTGRAARHHAAAWALAPTATAADALSTAFMVMGQADIERYCRDHPEVSALCVAGKGQGRRVMRYGVW